MFPLLLSPVYRIFGLNLLAMKSLVILLFMAFLWVLSLILRRHLPLPYVVACLWLVGLNPFCWQHKDRLLSEVPFLLFAYLAMLLLEKAHEPVRTRLWVWGLATGVVAFLAFGTRTVGVILVPSLIACELVRQRRLGTFALTAVATFAAGAILENLLLTLDGSYLDQVKYDPLLCARCFVGGQIYWRYSWRTATAEPHRSLSPLSVGPGRHELPGAVTRRIAGV